MPVRLITYIMFDYLFLLEIAIGPDAYIRLVQARSQDFAKGGAQVLFLVLVRYLITYLTFIDVWPMSKCLLG